MIITDLTNTQWTFQYGLDDGTGGNYSQVNYMVFFVCGGEEYDELNIHGTRTPYYEWFEIKEIHYHKVGDGPLVHQTAYKDGAWYLPNSITITGAPSGTEWQLTSESKITMLIRHCTTWKKVSFDIVNGTWADGTRKRKHIWTDVNSFNAYSEIPSGMIPDTGYSDVGEWDKDPRATVITDDTYFTYTFQPSLLPEHYVFYYIEGGSWADGTTDYQTEIVEENSYPIYYPVDMIPFLGYLDEGTWEPQDPWTKQITEDTEFTWIFTPEQPQPPVRQWAVLLRIVNGMWDDGSITAKQYTVLDGETIPDVPTGMMPFEGFGNGYWSADPSVPIREDRTFVYTFRRIAPSDEVHFFTLGDVKSIDLGVYIGGQHTYNAPKRDVTKISVPGRNGDLIQDNGRFLNVQVPYNVVVMEQFRERTDELKAWLLSTSKYRKLVDTYHPGTYRLARVGEDIVFNTSAFNLTGKTQVIFDCKPQRFLDEGDEVIVITEENNTIVNPTLFESEPILKVYVSEGGFENAIIRINDAEIELRSVDDYIIINSEIKECYKDNQSRNSHVVLANYKFPTLKPGINSFEFSSEITRIEVTPKWWTI